MTKNPRFGSIKMPALGYGTALSEGGELEEALEASLEAGYRHIDTAYFYNNEAIIGKVLKRWLDSGRLKREDLYIVTKLPMSGNRPQSVQKYFKRSLEALQLDYVDMYLNHCPFTLREVEGTNLPVKEDGTMDLEMNTDLVAVWREMEKLVDVGQAKAIGVSNFNQRQVTKIYENARIKPKNLQIELQIYNQQKKLVDFCKQNDIVVTAYSPLGSPGASTYISKFGHKIELPSLLKDRVVQEIARKHNKTAAQVLLRYLIQNGISTIPKSTNPNRVRENFNIFDFTLDEDDMSRLKNLDKGEDGRLFDFKFLKGVDKHPEYPFTRE